MKKSGFSMLLLLICVSMLSVMPVSAARKKSRYDLQFSELKVNKKKLKAGENGLEQSVRWIYFADCLQCIKSEYRIE